MTCSCFLENQMTNKYRPPTPVRVFKKKKKKKKKSNKQYLRR